jgi:hypothetical protein
MNEMEFRGKKRVVLNCIISIMTTRRLMRKRCITYLAYVADTKKKSMKLNNISILREFPDVFLGELPRLPLIQDIEVSIEVLPGIIPISQSLPYRMSPMELADLKLQLQKLLDKRFIQPNNSPWRAPVLFVKKKGWDILALYRLQTTK